MFEQITAFFSAIVIFFQMLFGGYPIFGGSSQDLSDFTVSGSISQSIQSYVPEKSSNTAFNKFTLSYDANTHIQGSISYSYKNKGYTEEFFMEPGENQSYSSFIDPYLSYGCGKKISEINFKTIDENPDAIFTLHSLKTSVEEVYNDFVYIENDRYKLGVSLDWGGAVAYLEDFNDNDPEITNLVNCNDPGRLLQQSYYGTSAPPYEPGEAFGYVWPYNPVQGGNQYGDSSKIIDIQKADGRIYIKSRAREWAKTDFTYCIMENTYELLENYVKADNRFVDYSHYNHPVTSQECPAFYTISALDRFVYYDGTQHWEDDNLTYRDDLEFWGDPTAIQIAKNFDTPQAESWSAFVNNDDWGFGVFTPDAYHVKAGRYEYNGTKEAKTGATNYIAPLGRFAIPHCEPKSYTYFLATGSTSEMRDIFHSLKDSTENQLFGQ